MNLNIKLLISALTIVLLFSCSSDSGIHTGLKNINLLDSYESVKAEIKTLKKAPNNVSESRGEGFNEYYSIYDKAIEHEGIIINPSSFYLFNKENKLVSMRLWYLCGANKKDFDLKKMTSIIDKNTNQKLSALLDKKDYTESGSNYQKQIVLDNAGEFPIIKYEVKIKG